MNHEQAHSWLTWLYGQGFDGRIWVGGHSNWRGMRFDNAEDATTYAATVDDANIGVPLAGVYHRLTTLSESAPRRGRDEDSVVLPAVMLDLDIRGPGHVADTYPRDDDQLREVLAAAGLPEPSAWVMSGHGRYPCWKLATPIDLTASPEEFARGRAGLRIIQRAVRETAAAMGLKLDNTSDLARVYRIPGTTNRKTSDAVTATWRMSGGETFDLGELIDGLKTATPAHALTPVPVPASSLFAQPSEISSLFAGQGGRQVRDARTFTVAEALAFVAPTLAALREAPDGEINVRLNAAACALSHFGEEFWDAAAADAQLHAALAETAYDGATWKAADTIASARRAMASDWRATLSATSAMADVADRVADDGVDALIGEMLSLDDMENAPPPRFLIHKLLQFDSESWLIGAPGSKKSFVAFDMAARIVRGEPWQGMRTNPADVVFIVAEGASGHGKRVKAWQRRYGKVERGGRQSVFTLPRPVQVRDMAAWAVLVGACRRLGQRATEAGRGLLVVIDTQARVTVGLNENDNGEMNGYVEAVSAIRRATGGCVLTIHHTKRGGGDARGASVIDGAQTTELKVTAEKGLAGRLHVEKQKDVDEIDPIDIGFEVIEVGVDDDGEVITSLVMAEPGSVAFKAAWESSTVEGGDAMGESARAVTPFKARAVVDAWIEEEVDARATIQHWAVQAIVDTAETLGLTQSEVRGLVEEKRGRVDNSTWRKAWQRVADENGPWAHVVVPAGGQRWTVDRMAIEKVRELVGDK